jgi:lathosterol oxidase
LSPVEAGIVALFVPLVATFMPIHYLALGAFLLVHTVYNVLGHSGFNVAPRWLVRLGLTNTVAHHHLHHERVHYNYALFFLWWDRLMGTEYTEAGQGPARRAGQACDTASAPGQFRGGLARISGFR